MTPATTVVVRTASFDITVEVSGDEVTKTAKLMRGEHRRTGQVLGAFELAEALGSADAVTEVCSAAIASLAKRRSA